MFKKTTLSNTIKNIKSFLINTHLLIKNSFRYKVILLVTLTVMLPLSLFGGYLYYFVYNNLLTQNLSKEIEEPLHQITDSVVSKYRIIDNSFNLFLSNQKIRSNLLKLNREEQTDSLKSLTRLEIESQLKYNVIHDYGWNSGLLKSVFVFEKEDNFFYLHHDYLHGEDFIADHINLYNNLEDKKTEETIILPSQKYNVIYFIKVIKPLISKETIGKLILSINEDELNNKFITSLEEKKYIALIIDKNKNIIYHTDRNKIGSQFRVNKSFYNAVNSNKEFKYNNEIYFIGSQDIDDLGLTSIIMVPKNEITSIGIITKYTFIILATILLALSISFYAAATITKPFNDLIEHIKKVKNKNFKSKMPKYRYTELNQVSLTFNNMLDEIENLFNEVYKKQLLLKESELKALQAQINPHFIFNVLETISWEAKMSGNENITVMVHSLGELLRSNFTFSNQEKIKIKEELKYVNFYLDLQNIRFGDKIHIHIYIENDDLLSLFIPKLSLQTIVENAVVHGLENKIGNGDLNIKIYSKEDSVYLMVTDNGIGFDTKELNKHLINNSDNNENGRKHIGLTNINQRIKLFYGEVYGITVESKINKGTTATIKIPIDKGDY
ncbi:sensor histidine kinase [Maledivibacter halophilus]|uniref:Two-component system, sensor histidine kinase YesM n=1 Tax=Maledivibacter halophilus TaxID=36842 RepID=A0A1T5KRB0_9FIRM|nr:sensor histidine kinase [Maledivibacter halophilus]SKC66191.1 two-component system, sensor histidine kinase YesM [Maledivibacter halophilus]